MAPRPFFGIFGLFGVFGLLGIFTMGCEAKPRLDLRNSASATSAAGSEGFAGKNPTAPVGERLLDTATPAPSAPPPVRVAAPTPAPVTTSRLTKPREHLPSWVPVTGRLSVVETPDLAENLGLVPKGTTKRTEGRISVADLLDKNAASASAQVAQPVSPSVTSATWLAANGHIRHGRSRR